MFSGTVVSLKGNNLPYLPPSSPSPPLSCLSTLKVPCCGFYNQSSTPSTNSDNYKNNHPRHQQRPFYQSHILIYLAGKGKDIYQPTVFVSSAEAAHPPSHSASMMPILAAGGCFTPRNLNLGSALWKSSAQSSASRSFALWNSSIARSMFLFDGRFD